MRIPVMPVAAAASACVLAAVFAGPPAAAEAAVIRLTAGPAAPIAAERVTFSGHLTTRFARPVRLQMHTESGWKSIVSATSRSTGTFAIVARMPTGTRTFRVFAPRTTRIAAQWTSTLNLTSRAQSASVSFVAAAVAQSLSGTADLTPAAALISPVRAGREVVLQRRTDGVWSTLLTGKEDSAGRVRFLAAVPAAEPRAYRVVASAANGAPAVASAARPPGQWARVFNDDFSGTKLDLSKWGNRYVGLRGPNRQCSEVANGMAWVSGGRARLTVKPVPAAERKRSDAECPYGEYYNSMISTMNGRFDFAYGIMAARIRFPDGAGQHGSLWSQPARPGDEPGNPAVSGAEVDVVESFGDLVPPLGPVHNVYWRAADSTLATAGAVPDVGSLLRTGTDWTDDYHVYSVEWTPTEYIFRIDGRETFRTGRGVSGIPQYLILSLLTSDWELPRLQPTQLEAMAVDWVRVWQH